jgi:hypothetical protein
VTGWPDPDARATLPGSGAADAGLVSPQEQAALNAEMSAARQLDTARRITAAIEHARQLGGAAGAMGGGLIEVLGVLNTWHRAVLNAPPAAGPPSIALQDAAEQVLAALRTGLGMTP